MGIIWKLIFSLLISFWFYKKITIYFLRIFCNSSKIDSFRAFFDSLILCNFFFVFDLSFSCFFLLRYIWFLHFFSHFQWSGRSYPMILRMGKSSSMNVSNSHRILLYILITFLRTMFLSWWFFMKCDMKLSLLLIFSLCDCIYIFCTVVATFSSLTWK